MEGIEDFETLHFEHGGFEGYEDFNLEADLARGILTDRTIGADYTMVVTELDSVVERQPKGASVSKCPRWFTTEVCIDDSEITQPGRGQ